MMASQRKSKSRGQGAKKVRFFWDLLRQPTVCMVVERLAQRFRHHVQGTKLAAVKPQDCTHAIQMKAGQQCSAVQQKGRTIIRTRKARAKNRAKKRRQKPTAVRKKLLHVLKTTRTPVTPTQNRHLYLHHDYCTECDMSSQSREVGRLGGGDTSSSSKARPRRAT